MTDKLSKNQRRRRNAALRKRAKELGLQDEGLPIEYVAKIVSEQEQANIDFKKANNRYYRQASDEQEMQNLSIDKLLDQALRSRHRVIFDWLCEVLGKTPEELVCELIRTGTLREKASYTEAMGGGGASSRSIETLVERVPVKR